MMPHLNGSALAQRLKSSARFREVPVVLMSASCHSPQAGAADHFLPKPFELHEIERFVERYVDPTAAALLTPERERRREYPSTARTVMR
jgi:CheY-like chemotaxis protein